MAVPKKKTTHMRTNIKYKKSNYLLLNKIYGFKIQKNRYMTHDVDYVTGSPRKSDPDGSRLKLRVDDARFSMENICENVFSKP